MLCLLFYKVLSEVIGTFQDGTKSKQLTPSLGRGGTRLPLRPTCAGASNSHAIRAKRSLLLTTTTSASGASGSSPLAGPAVPNVMKKVYTTVQMLAD